MTTDSIAIRARFNPLIKPFLVMKIGLDTPFSGERGATIALH
jgi:hypothetical protein